MSLTKKKKKIKKDSKIGYMCAVMFQHEMDPDCSIGIPVYSKVNYLKDAHECVKECGIVKVKVTLEKWVKSQRFRSKK